MTTTAPAAGLVQLPGRLGHPEMDLRTDPRADPRLVAALASFGLDTNQSPAPVTPGDPLAAKLEYVLAAEAGYEAVFTAYLGDVPPVEGVERTEQTIRGVDGNDILLHVHRPVGQSAPLPGVLFLHGGGMTLLRGASPAYTRWRDELAATGLVVVGVEFRNAGGILGPHPFPAGLDDCTSALQHVHEQREQLQISRLVISGESGGGNLTLATTLRAQREDRLHMVDGVYALCPYISGAYGWPAERMAKELPSLLENDGYFLNMATSATTASVYDPDGSHSDDPLCWPYFAQREDLQGLPPHVISVNELDPLRDEGLAYYRKLASAGVQVVGRTVLGTSHAGDVIFRAALPDVYRATVNDIHGFAAGL